jgi:hypothetical protein
MVIAFKNNSDIIIYTIEKVISYSRYHQQIVVAQCMQWLVLIIESQQGLVLDIDNLLRQQTTACSILDETASHVHPD